ncbi:hypothetical protein [Pseudaestuariivita sp.]|uniref:hypothetical protein n=1 Tax=Pseudaestuariivita sp. TaxID=2211669 RepID=UPI00405A0A04
MILNTTMVEENDMALITMLFGGVAGTFAAVTGWLLFGLSLGSAAMLYAALAFCLPCAVIAVAAVKRADAAPKGHPLHARG